MKILFQENEEKIRRQKQKIKYKDAQKKSTNRTLKSINIQRHKVFNTMTTIYLIKLTITHLVIRTIIIIATFIYHNNLIITHTPIKQL